MLKMPSCTPTDWAAFIMIVSAAFTVTGSHAQTGDVARAQRYPSKPVRMIVPYAPGGSSDIIARLFGQRLSETLGQTFVVDNRPGAGGMIGTEPARQIDADGYTLILQDMPHTINPAVYGKVPYDPVRDFTPIRWSRARRSGCSFSRASPRRG